MDPSIFGCFASSERASRAFNRIHAKKYDTDSWNMLIKEAVNKNIDEVEPFYEELLKIFPTCGRFWRAYVEHQMKFKRYDKVSKIFQRSLEEVLSIDLYKCYLNFVREAKASEPDLMYKAYRYTLDRVGTDPNAISIYNDYIQFLKEREVDGSYLDSQKITAVRKAYQEGVMNPMFHIDTLWKEYIAYEHSINPIIAEKMVQDRSRDHMNARRVAKEWEVTIRGLNRSWAAYPPSFTPEELRQVEIWRRYISWEKSNPLRTENNHIILKRVTFAYRQCLLCFGHHPNVWLEYAGYLEEQMKALTDKDVELGKRLLKEATQLFERATRGLMRHNLLVHFAYADFEEIRNNKKKALEIYNNLVEASKEDERIDLTLVYIQFMRFTCRTEGSSAARLIFKRAREDERCTHHVYTAAALMEYHCNKDQKIADKIFKAGLKKFKNCPDYVLSYIHFMNSLNEENNIRTLFELVLTTYSLPSKDTVEIWNSFLEFEAGRGDLSSINKVERRRTLALEKVFPRSAEASWVVDKYKFQDLYPCSINELKSLGYDPQQSATDLASIRRLLSSIGGYLNFGDTQQVSSATSNMNLKKNKSANRLRITNGGMFSDATEVDCDTDFTMTILNQTSMCSPDLDQMLPFKPVLAAGFGAHTVPGGVFPPPPAIGNLLSRLPQPSSFWGPYVDIEELCNIIRLSDFDDLFNNLVEQRREANKSRSKKPRLD